MRIGDLVSPLRYDVLLRKRHFEFVARNRELFVDDFDAYERLARAEPYFVWFERVMVPSWRSHLVDDPEGFDREWRQRLRKSYALYESFEERGFDPANPIELLAGNSVRPSASGKRTSRTLFAGDGNHRLALLLAAGVEALSGSHYQVKRYRSLVPADTTGLLLRRTGAGWGEYKAFIALGYPDADLDISSGRVSVSSPDPALAAEVDAVIAVDAPYLEGATP